MLIPQFSLRWVLAVTAACAVFSLILASALRGSPWAIALSVGVASLVVMLAFHGAVFFGVWLFSLLVPDRRAAGPGGGSPFASGVPLAKGQVEGTQDGKPRK
ncbi:MAG TPA: hypothetical protein VMV69_04330 [Pirellulales bacterium]|nr:hypothetical protein [Pirellulales bacterium]